MDALILGSSPLSGSDTRQSPQNHQKCIQTSLTYPIPGRLLICPFNLLFRAIYLCKRTFPPKRSVKRALCSNWNLKISLRDKKVLSLHRFLTKTCTKLYQNCPLEGDLKRCATLVEISIHIKKKNPFCVTSMDKNIRTAEALQHKISKPSPCHQEKYIYTSVYRRRDRKNTQALDGLCLFHQLTPWVSSLSPKQMHSLYWHNQLPALFSTAPLVNSNMLYCLLDSQCC